MTQMKRTRVGTLVTEDNLVVYRGRLYHIKVSGDKQAIENRLMECAEHEARYQVGYDDTRHMCTLTQCLEFLEGSGHLHHRPNATLYMDFAPKSFGYSMGGIHGGVIWHHTPEPQGEWSCHS